MKIQSTIDIAVPRGTVNISDTATNPGWVTLAKKHKGGAIDLFSCHTSDIEKHDLLDDKNWLRLNDTEFKALKSL